MDDQHKDQVTLPRGPVVRIEFAYSIPILKQVLTIFSQKKSPNYLEQVILFIV